MLRYLLPLLYIASYCVASDQPDIHVNVLQGKSACENIQLNSTDKFQCRYGYGFNPAMRTLYIIGSMERRMRKLADLLDSGGNDYVLTPGIGAHKLYFRKESWAVARRICNKEGGHMAVINSNSEERILVRLLQEKNIGDAWIGVHDLFEEGDWLTILDEPIERSGWAGWTTRIANLPDNYGGRQNCGLLLRDGGMDDYDCPTKHSFFCEINL